MTSRRPALPILLAAVLLAGGPAHAEDPPPSASSACVCGPGTGACQHFLRNPKKPTADPCWCPKCRDVSPHDGKTLPPGWNAVCFGDKREEVYLRRHAAAWGIVCSDCVEGDTRCKGGDAPCPACAWSGPETKDFALRPARATVLGRLAKERRFFRDGKRVRVLYGPRFYLVTDVEDMKVQTGPATTRQASGHEWAHLMMERAEYARREFVEHLGDELVVDKPTGMYFPRSGRDEDRLAAHYLGNETANVLYGGSDSSTVADGFCFHGFVTSMEQFGQGGDAAIHFAMRHMVGHELMSCWVVVDGHNRALPRWLHVGAAHWLSRLQPRFREDAFACHLEGSELELPGRGWDAELRRMASQPKPGAIEVLLAKSAQGQLDEDDHRRAWSFMDLALSEWREPWVGMLRALRRRAKARDAFVEHLGVTPEIFDERWRERVLGRRGSLGPGREDSAEAAPAKLGARERESIRKERDAATLAALVRGLGTVAEPATAELLVDLLARDEPLVRETVLVALLEIEDPATQEAAWKRGLAHADPVARACTARLCASRRLTAAVPALRRLLDDANWYPRAEGALALGALGDAASLGRLVALTDDPADKARVAAMDALAALGDASASAVDAVAEHLDSSRWQLRVTAAQSLGAIRSTAAVDPLIDRMEVESGRVRREIREALERITLDDLGERPEHWRAWWDGVKAQNGGRVPDRPPDPGTRPAPAGPDPDERYATEYFGIEIHADRVAFVLDTSGSMKLRFAADPKTLERSGRRLQGGDKLEMCKGEIERCLRTLDPRSHFNVLAFGDDLRTWRDDPVPASKPNVDDAVAWLRNRPAAGETNYYDALRAVLDLGDRPDTSPSFRDTPDTITFLTDGMPTRGALTDPKTLLNWYSDLNRYARVKTHVIAFGEKGLEVELLRALAERNGGTFVHVRGKDG